MESDTKAAKRWASAGDKPTPEILLAEVEKRAWGRAVAKLMADRSGFADEDARLSRVLDRIKERYGASGRAVADARVAKGAREGADWYERNLADGNRKPVNLNRPPGAFWRSIGK